MEDMRMRASNGTALSLIPEESLPHMPMALMKATCAYFAAWMALMEAWPETHLEQCILRQIGATEEFYRLAAADHTIMVLIGNDEPSLEEVCIHDAASSC